MQIIQNAIAGKLTQSVSARTQPVFNPATGEAIGTLPLSTLDEINAAVAAAKAAQPAWGNTTPMKRARVMFKFKELLEKHADELAREISREHGKVHDDALGELARGIDCVDFACGVPQLLKGEFSRNVGPSIDTYSGNPVAAAAGLGTLETYKDEGLLTRGADLAKYWEDALHSLKGLPHVIDIRNLGLIGAVELEPIAGSPTKRAFSAFVKAYEAGILIRTTGDIIAMSPPLIIEKHQIDTLIGTLGEILKTLE